VSLQGITRAVRHTIASEFYEDIDIENAHPTILAHVCKQVIPDLKTPYLNHYIRDRNAVIEKELGI
jgi:hypothetical protein